MFYIEDIEKILKTNSDPKRAEKMSAYMRNHFDFYGIGADKRRKLTNTYIKEAKNEGAIDWPFLAKLFSHNKRELAYLGLDILKAQSKLLSLEDFDILVSLAQIKPWWDTIDNIDGLIGLLGHKDDDFEKKYNSNVNLAIEEFDERYPEVNENDNIFDVKFENIEVDY